MDLANWWAPVSYMGLSELVQAALQAQTIEEVDVTAKNPALEEIVDHAPPGDVFVVADRLVASSIRNERKLGIRILRELGRPQRPYAAKSVQILRQLAGHEPDPELLIWTISALGNQHREEALPVLWTLAENPEPSVRDAVAGAISAAAANSTLDDQSIDILIGLSLDPDSDVRFSAMFELAEWRSQGINDQRIVQALAGAERDPDPRVVRIAFRDLDDSSS